MQIIAAATLLVGNFIALSQTNLKRLLAYSSIAHAGYIIMALAASGSEPGVTGIANTAVQSALIYLMAYMFTNLGAFGVVVAVERDNGEGIEINDLVGLYGSHPWLAVAMAVFMFSLIGIPLTAGFIGKWLVFNAVIQAGLIPLAIVGVLTSVVSAYYYVRVVVVMFLDTDAAGPAEVPGATTAVRYAIYASMAGVVLVGVLPSLLSNLVDIIALI